MNKQEYDLLITLKKHPFVSQRNLAKDSGYSLGLVNTALKSLCDNNYLTADFGFTKKALALFENNAPKRAVILAAGSGIRMVPINAETPKALLQVKGERLIERQIRMLNEIGVTDIAIVVGFLKEQFEYLIDKYGITLVYNCDYYTKNNLHSLSLVSDWLCNCYVVPCDLWCQENPFSRDELYSWYAVTDELTQHSEVFANRKGQLAKIPYNKVGNRMFGICYLDKEVGEIAKKRLALMDKEVKHSHSFWEEAVYDGKKMLPLAKVLPSDSNFEINTYEQLRDIDSDSLQLKSEKIAIIAKAMNCNADEIVDIKIQKKGMTNRSFLFTLRGKRYIMRVPGEGTDSLINRREEGEVYKVIWDKGLCDDVIYINPENGYKITSFLDNARVCNATDDNDLRLCMKRLKEFHDMKLKVNHTFDIFEKINFYESLWLSDKSQYMDYEQTKEKVFSLKTFVDRYKNPYCLTHIDAVPDNFLFCTDKDGKDDIRLIDWEYAAMQDPHVDIAMFIIYSMYDRNQADRLIDIYFNGECPLTTRIKIYCYIAMCGLLWSNWCEYKRDLGVEFGEYSLKQYRFAKEYYAIATQLIREEGLDA